MRDSLLIILTRNPELGRVKTRLAATVGDEKALAIFHLLLTHTQNITQPLATDCAIFYSNFIDKEDKWGNDRYIKQLQQTGDLGDRMEGAFHWAFDQGYNKVCIIGTDCLELTTAIITEGFTQLASHDIVIGPSEDGGYYMLGMKKLHPLLFHNKAWGTDKVFASTTQDFKNKKLTSYRLPVLNDIDDERDWESDPSRHHLGL